MEIRPKTQRQRERSREKRAAWGWPGDCGGGDRVDRVRLRGWPGGVEFCVNGLGLYVFMGFVFLAGSGYIRG
jgi:hypothetical protein